MGGCLSARGSDPSFFPDPFHTHLFNPLNIESFHVWFHGKYWRLPLVYSAAAVCVCPSRPVFWTDVGYTLYREKQWTWS